MRNFNIILKFRVVLVILIFLDLSDLNAQVFTIARTIERANRNQEFFPVFSDTYSNLDTGTSYKVQKAFVDNMLLNNILSGFKAGLTSNAIQEMLHLSEPVYGVLFKSGELMSPSIITLDNYRNLLIALELGYIMNIDISESLENTTQLAGLVNYIYPVVELPDIGFKDINDIKSVDIISTNVGSNKYILGNKYKFDKSLINDLNIKMYQNGELISTVVTRDAGENQLSYLLWMINNITEAGYKIKAGNILITGSIGNTKKADKGVYMTDFSDFGKIYFEVR